MQPAARADIQYRRMVTMVKQFWFLFGLILIFLLIMADSSGLLAAAGALLKQNRMPEIIIFLIFTVSGLLIEKDQIIEGIKDYKTTALTLTIIIFISPLVAVVFSFLGLDTAVTAGFFILSVMPTTLSSGVVMTGVAGGNMAHALFTTIVSSFAGIVTIPVSLSVLLPFLDKSEKLVIDQPAIMVKLIFLVIVPLMAGIFAKNFLFRMTNIEKSFLQRINQSMILLMVFISLAGAKHLLSGSPLQLGLIVILTAVFHSILLCTAFLLVKGLNVPDGSFQSVIFMGTQKTLPLSIMIQVGYFSEYPNAAIVLVMHHIVHLIIDGYLSAKMGKTAV